MALKTSTGKLYMLFSACFPQDEDVKKIFLAEKISESEEYRSLCIYPLMSEYVRKNLNKEQLKRLTYDKLCELEKSISIIQETIELLLKAIQYSNGWELTPEDRPDFTNYSSVLKLKNKLCRDIAGKNITNIGPTNYNDIFSDDLISNVDDLMDSFSIEQMKNVEEEIKTSLADKKYCIPHASVEKRKREIELAAAEIDQLNINSKIFGRKLLTIKLWVVALAVIVFLCVGVSGLMYSLGLVIYTLGLIALTIVFLIKG